MRIGNEKNQRAPSFCPPSFVSSFLALPFWSNSSVLLPKLPPSSGLDMLMQSPQTLSPSVWPKLNRLTAAPWSSGCKTEQEELEQSTYPLCLLTIWAQSQYCTLTSSLTVTLLTYPMMFYRKLLFCIHLSVVFRLLAIQSDNWQEKCPFWMFSVNVPMKSKCLFKSPGDSCSGTDFTDYCTKASSIHVSRIMEEI